MSQFAGMLPSPNGRIREDLRSPTKIADIGERLGVRYELRAGRENIWVSACNLRADILALRCGIPATIEGEPSVTRAGGGWICDWRIPLGALRLKVVLPPASQRTIRCTTSFLPTREVRLSPIRDLFGAEGATGEVHTTQRDLRTGVLYASYKAPQRASVLYLQDFSSLTELFEITQKTPAGTVGGTLDEGGFLAPFDETCVMPEAHEFVVSDAFLAIIPDCYPAPNEVAGHYLDLLADVYLALEKPVTTYHDWPERAGRTMRDLCLSPSCTYKRAGQRFVMPYVADSSKPPESMVQLTVLANTLEYEAWRGSDGPLSRALLEGFERFFDAKIGSVVRWLPGEAFGEQSEQHMDHESMDSWYLYHSLFNVSRLATLGNEAARAIFRKSLAYAIRVAQRFNYRWPIFFNLKTLEIIRAESEPGEGGERDVAGLYALVMLHANELFGDSTYLDEAKRAADAMSGLGFRLAYQTNTTGFAAEAMLRLWLLTEDRSYLEMSELCMANIFDNMWLWRCEYGRARHYRTFFGLFPLHDAPYLAAYEELESQAKFHDYLWLGKGDVRPSLRLLLAEYQKYSLDRSWFYYPDTLPFDMVAEKSRNGKIERTLSVPLEDMQDGRKPSGAVGQELYGAGLAFVYTTRHYIVLASANCMLYCSYPIYRYLEEMRGSANVISFQVGGDKRCGGELRIIRLDAEQPVPSFSIRQRGRSAPVKSTVTVEGHTAYQVVGNTSYEVRVPPRTKKPATVAS